MATKTFKIGLSNTDKQNMAQEVYERLLALTFPEYDTSTNYSVGDFVVYNNQLYKCIGSTSGAWDSTKWQLATLNDLVTDIEDAVQFVNDKANVDGNYPTMTVGLADGLSSDRVIEDQDVACPPITFGTTGGDAEVQSGINKFTELRGNSVVWNQLQERDNFSVPNITTTYANGKFTITYNLPNSADANLAKSISCIANHKYLLHKNKKSDTGALTTYFNRSNPWGVIAGTVQNGDVIYSYTSDSIITLHSYQATASTGVAEIEVDVIDLTQMFGAGNEPTDVNDIRVQWAIAQATKNPAYNAGELLSSQSTSLISRMRNQWDEEWEVGSISSSTGQPYADNNVIRSKNFIQVIPNETYKTLVGSLVGTGNMECFFYDANKNYISNAYYGNVTMTIPSNAYFMKFRMGGSYGTVYKNDICIYINYDTPNLPYVPYEQQVVELPNLVLRSAGSAYDVAYSSGGGKRRIGVVDLSTLTWAKENNHFYSNPLTIKQPSNNNVVANILCDKYVADTANNVNNEIATNIIGITTGSRVYLYNANITQSSDISGTLYYELATETEIDNPGWSENLETDNYGTLEFTSNQTLQVPQAYYVEYTVNLAEWVDTGYVRTGGDANDIALNSELNAKFEAYLKSLSGYDASATQQLKNISGTLTWVTEE